ncbi:hypothetical protein PR048_014537 [Dryococelus australis]|uniref:Uncharacterized protein n=1 Tax=Dryococelus australis TaxID=614101 RepID=A0ABQ9HEN5_9NEOP|nr:hypothetical protein PR048_014537 [Dryococelus australis]
MESARNRLEQLIAKKVRKEKTGAEKILRKKLERGEIERRVRGKMRMENANNRCWSNRTCSCAMSSSKFLILASADRRWCTHMSWPSELEQTTCAAVISIKGDPYQEAKGMEAIEIRWASEIRYAWATMQTTLCRRPMTTSTAKLESCAVGKNRHEDCHKESDTKTKGIKSLESFSQENQTLLVLRICISNHHLQTICFHCESIYLLNISDIML